MTLARSATATASRRRVGRAIRATTATRSPGRPRRTRPARRSTSWTSPRRSAGCVQRVATALLERRRRRAARRVPTTTTRARRRPPIARCARLGTSAPGRTTRLLPENALPGTSATAVHRRPTSSSSRPATSRSTARPRRRRVRPERIKRTPARLRALLAPWGNTVTRSTPSPRWIAPLATTVFPAS